MLHIITSAEFIREVVEPDHKDAFQNPESIRHAFHLVLGLFSLRDWVFEEFSAKPGWPYGNLTQFQRFLEKQCREFAIIADVANSAKHLELNRGSRTGTITGAKCVRVFGGSGMLGFGPIGGGPLGSVPTIEIQVANDQLPLLHTAERVLFMWRDLFKKNGWR